MLLNVTYLRSEDLLKIFPFSPITEMLYDLGLRGPDIRDPSGTFVAGLGMTPGGLDLGLCSGLESSVSAETTGWTSGLTAEK